MPLTAAMIGSRERSIARVNSWPLAMLSPPAEPNSLMSAPAAKNLGPAPVRISARQVSSASASVIACMIPATTARLMALAGGWSMVTMTSAPSRSTRTTSFRTLDTGAHLLVDDWRRNGSAPGTARGSGAIIGAVTDLPPLPDLPPAFEQESLAALDDGALDDLLAALAERRARHGQRDGPAPGAAARAARPLGPDRHRAAPSRARRAHRGPRRGARTGQER